jgi:hypothetical protein
VGLLLLRVARGEFYGQSTEQKVIGSFNLCRKMSGYDVWKLTA